VSALGRGPEVDSTSGLLTIRPRDVAPMWAEVPMLYALHRSVPGLIVPANNASNAARSFRSRPAAEPQGGSNRDQPAPRVFKETGT
jgi:hypothetical protein